MKPQHISNSQTPTDLSPVTGKMQKARGSPGVSSQQLSKGINLFDDILLHRCFSFNDFSQNDGEEQMF